MARSRRKFAKLLKPNNAKSTIYTTPDTANATNSKMPSAAEKAFAIPELLEMVLLHLSYYNLFRLFRTTRAVRDTIEHSVKLRRLMHLECQHSEDQHDIPPTPPTIPPCFNYHIIKELLLFHYSNIEAFETFAVSPGSRLPQQLILTLTVPAPDPQHPWTTRAHHRMYSHTTASSWDHKRLSLTDQPVKISITVKQKRSHNLQHLPGNYDYRFDWYEEVHDFSAEEGTLGALAVRIDAIQTRTPAEHQERERRWRWETQRDGPKKYRQAKRRRCY